MEYNYTAVIIEPRKHPALEFVLDNFNKNLSNEWKIILFHGNNNIEYCNDILRKINSSRIFLNNLNVDNLSISDYNKLLTNIDFYKNIPTEIFLIFQTDTMICSKYKNLINNYFNYDYVGAPWKLDIDWVTDKNNKKNFIGNGGLSIRKKSKMLEIINNCKYDGVINEDFYFSQGCNNNVNKPEYDEALKFSIETVYNKESFGIHKAWEYLEEYEDEIESRCTGYKKLIKLNESNKFDIIKVLKKNKKMLLFLVIIVIIIYIMYIKSKEKENINTN